MDKSFARLIRKKMVIQITNINNKRVVISIDSKDIKRIKKGILWTILGNFNKNRQIT